MLDGQVQVFISYAHNDNVGRAIGSEQLRLNSSEEKGFVGYLHEQLVFELLEQGYSNLRIWRDPHIGKADYFGPKIRDEILASSIFIVIMSRNWLASQYCQDELSLFVERWKSSPASSQRSLVVVSKHRVDPELWPSQLQGQVGFKFYDLDQLSGITPETQYFSRGEVRDERYWSELKSLAHTLGARAKDFGGKADPSKRRQKMTTLSIIPPSDGRKIYLAKPANDMRTSYDNMVKELAGRGYRVVPDPSVDLPYDSLESAIAIIDKGLAEAEASVHLLGNSAGFKHDGSSDPIVNLQLRRAAAKAAPFEDRSDARRGFHRVIWAPSVVDDSPEMTQTNPKRDPCVVLESFDKQISGDCIEGNTFGAFVDFLGQHLVRESPARMVLGQIDSQSKVYVYHPKEDMEYAFSVAKALRQRNVEALLPAFDDSEYAQTQLHRQYLRDCDSVILCWATGSETWAKVNSHALLDWQNLGRTKVFTRRGLVAGPPPGMRKRMFVELYPKNEIDVVVDLTACQDLTPEHLNPLFDGE